MKKFTWGLFCNLSTYAAVQYPNSRRVVRFMPAGVGWDFGTMQEFLGFLGMFEIRLTSRRWAALDGIHGLPWKHNRNIVKNEKKKKNNKKYACVSDPGNT